MSAHDRARALDRRGLLVVVVKLAQTHHVLVGDILGDASTQAVRRARDALCWHLSERAFSLREVGQLVGLSHTAVMRSIQRHEEIRNASN